MEIRMGFGPDIVVDISDDVKRGETKTVKMQLDGGEITTLFNVYRDSKDVITRTNVIDSFEGMELTFLAGEYDNSFWLAYTLENEKRITTKELKFYTKTHTFTIWVGDISKTWNDLYIEPANSTKALCFSKIETAGLDGYAYVTIKDFQYDIGDVGETGTGSLGDWEIITKKETDNKGWTYKIKVPTPTTAKTYTLKMNFGDCPRKNEYWRAVGPYKSYSVYLYDLFLPQFYIKAEGNIYRLTTVKRLDADRVIYIAVAGTPLSNMCRYYIKTSGRVSEIETKNEAT